MPTGASDRFTEYFGAASNNVQKQLASGTLLIRRLRRLHGAFETLTSNLHEPQSLVSPVFVLDVYAKFLGASLLALAGQLRETYPLLRAGLESGMYAVLLEGDDDLCKAWFERDADDAARAKLRRDVSTTNMIAAVERRDRSLATLVRLQYEESITRGAHPNPMAVAGSLEIKETAERSEYIRPILGGSLVEVAVTLGDLVSYGPSMLELSMLLLSHRSELLGLRQHVTALRLPLVRDAG